MLIQPRRATETICIYTHAIDGTIIYVGSCPLAKLYAAPDAQMNTLWQRLVQPSAWVEMQLHGMFDNADEAATIEKNLIECHQPACNIHGTSVKDAKAVRCITDGMTYANANQAALAYGISRQSMSAHLHRRTGYRTVKGRTFERVAHGG